MIFVGNLAALQTAQLFSPSSVTACGGATFPRQGGRLIGASTDTTPEWGECQGPRLPPHGGRWHGEAVTDEGETPRSALLPELYRTTLALSPAL